MRVSWIRITIAVLCLLFGVAAWQLGPRSSANLAAQAQTNKRPAAPQLQPVSVTTTVKPTIPEPTLIAPAGTELYTARRGEAIPTIARRYLGRTRYLTSAELAEAIRAANHKSDKSNILKSNEWIIIPGILPAPIVEKAIPISKAFEVRAIYLTGVMAGSDHGLRTIRHWREVGGNAVVFDIKDSDGSVTIPFEHPLGGQHKVYIHDLPKLVHFLHQQNMHAIARIAIFRDETLVIAHPELAVQSRRTHQAWRENGKLVWTDPSNPKVQDYDIALAKHVAQLGVDEIEFDYVRFPAEGDQKDAQFVFQKEQPELAAAGDQRPSCGEDSLGRPADANSSGTESAAAPSPTANAAQDSASKEQQNTASSLARASAARRRGARRGVDAKNRQAPKGRQNRRMTACHLPRAPRGPQRSEVIAGFLKKAYAELHPTGVLLSLDVFGVMAWQRQVDLAHTGQDIVQMALYCDVLSPMIYPSHFFGMDNIARPGDAPAHFIGESMDRFELITKGSGVVIRPWLQAFRWRTRTYSPEYIKIQVEAAKNKGGIGFLFWNAANDYSKPFIAMPGMKAANAKEKDKFFRGDELPAPSVQAALQPTAPGTH